MIARIAMPMLAAACLMLPAPAWAAIELVTVSKATQKDCKLAFTVEVRAHPNGSGAKLLTLAIPAKQVEALYDTPNTHFTFQIRDGSRLPLNVPLALARQRDGSLRAEFTLDEEYGKKAWALLHVWLHPDGSGTQFSIDLGSYLTNMAGVQRQQRDP